MKKTSSPQQCGQARASESVGVVRIDRHLHRVAVRMSLEDPRARPAVFPVPNPNGFVIGADSTRGRVGWTAKDLTKSLCASNSTIFSSVSQLAITIFRKEEMFQLSKNSKFGGFFWVCVTAGWRFCCTRVRVSSCEVKILGRRGFVSWV